MAAWQGLTRWRPYALSVLRVVVGYLFLWHGYDKFGNGVALLTLPGLAMLLELAGGVLLVLGLFTRPVAFVLSGEMAFAYFLAHAPSGHALVPLSNGGDLAVTWCFLFLYFVFAGGGVWALDNLRGR